MAIREVVIFDADETEGCYGRSGWGRWKEDDGGTVYGLLLLRLASAWAQKWSVGGSLFARAQ